jgi:hypothetical protein
MNTPFDRRTLPLTDADRAECQRWEKANARAVDQAEALPITYRNNGRVAKCLACRCDVPAHGLCRWCRRGEQ